MKVMRHRRRDGGKRVVKGPMETLRKSQRKKKMREWKEVSE